MPGEVGPAWGRRGAPVSPAGQWPGRDLDGPLGCSRGGCRGPGRRKRARRRGVGVPERCVLNLRWDPSPPAPGAGWTGTRESDGPSGGGETRSSGGAVAAGVWPPGPALTGKWFLAPAGPPRPPPAAPGLRSLCPDPGDPSPRRGERPRLTPGAFSSTATRASLWGPAHAGRPG